MCQKYTGSKFEFGFGQWYLTELCLMNFEKNEKFSVSALSTLLKGYIYIYIEKADIWYVDYLQENTDQVWILFLFDDFWQTTLPLEHREKMGHWTYHSLTFEVMHMYKVDISYKLLFIRK